MEPWEWEESDILNLIADNAPEGLSLDSRHLRLSGISGGELSSRRTSPHSQIRLAAHCSTVLRRERVRMKPKALTRDSESQN